MAYNPSARLNSLLSTYTPPSNCTTLAYPLYGGSQAWYYQTCSSSSLYDCATCWPPATVSSATTAASVTGLPPASPLNGYGVYSPGLACPAGYYTACTQAILPNGSPSPLPTSGTSFNFQFSLYPGQTAHGCCPSSFTPKHYGSVQTCAFTITTSTVLTVEKCGDSTFSGVSALTIPQKGLQGLTLAAPMIQLNFRSDDLTSMTSAAPSRPTSMLPMSTSTAPAPGSSLSSGAEAGIGVGVALAVIAVIAFVAFWIRRKKKRSNVKADGTTVQEMDGRSAAREMYASHGVSELPGATVKDGDKKLAETPTYELSAVRYGDDSHVDKE